MVPNEEETSVANEGFQKIGCTADYWRKKILVDQPEEVTGELISSVRTLNPADTSVPDNFSEVLLSYCQVFTENFILTPTADEGLGEKKSSTKVLLCKYEKCLLSFEDVKYLVLRAINDHVSKDKITSKEGIRNTFILLKYIPCPVPVSKKRKFVGCYYDVPRKIKKYLFERRLRSFFQTVWLQFLKLPHPDDVLLSLLPHLANKVMDAMPDPQLFAEFFVRSYEKGDQFSVPSLAGIFQLMIKHNFDFPDFYNKVYSLTQYGVCYSLTRKQFFELLDLFLSSTHLPAYMVASFVKRVSRLCLSAPVACLEPMLMLIRNLLVRHQSVRVLLHRDSPVTVDGDPYEMDEPDLNKTNALDSSLWELKHVFLKFWGPVSAHFQTLQHHWFLDIAKRANLVDKGVPHLEGFVRWRSADDIWMQNLSKKFGAREEGSTENDEARRYLNRYDMDSDENESQVVGQKHKMSNKRGLPSEVEGPKTVPINFKKPRPIFEADSFAVE